MPGGRRSPPPVRVLADCKDVRAAPNLPRRVQWRRGRTARAVRSAEARRDRAQGQEPAAVRAAAAREHQAGHPRPRCPGADLAARGRNRAAGAGRGGGRGGNCRPAGRADAQRHGPVPGLPRGARRQGPRGGGGRRRAAHRRPPGQLRGPGQAPGQALPDELIAARHPDRREDPGGVRLPGQPVPPGHHRVRGGRSVRGVRVHRGAAGPGRASGQHERPRAGADVRRHRLAGGRLPDDAARPALQLPALLRHAADRARVGVQGVRPGPGAGQVPGRITAVRGRVRADAATAGVLGSRAGCRSWRSGG